MTFSNPSPTPTPCVSPSQRAADLMAQVDRLWVRCEKGVDFVFPEKDDDPEKRSRAARLLVSLIDEAQELEREALSLDPVAVRDWTEKRERFYREKGWEWPPDPEAAKEERLALIQTGWNL